MNPYLNTASPRNASHGSNLLVMVFTTTALILFPGVNPASAQESTATENSEVETAEGVVVLEEYVVNTVRGSLIGAQEIKENSYAFVDSIVAEDIGKLPDNTVADALQRVPGIQVTRDNGEVNSVVIRGLPNLGTTVNGNEIFTGSGRGVALQDLPADLVGGVDVYKTSSADRLEGGIAGLIDIRLRRPFDLEEGPQFGASGRYIHGENAEKDSWVGSALASNRWKTSGGGEFGALIGGSYQNIHFSDQRVFNFLWEPVAIDPAIAGGNTTVELPVTAGSLLTPGDRKRTALDVSLQWRPNDELEFYTDLLYTGYRNRHEVFFFIGFPRFGAFQSVDLNPGTNVPRSVVSTNNFHLTSTQAFDDKTDGYQWVTGGKWHGDRLTISSDIIYNWNKIENRGVIVDTQFVVPDGDTGTFSFDLNTPHGTNVDISGADITDGDNFRFWGLFDNRQHYSGEQIAWKADAVYDFDTGFFRNVEGGIRISERDAKQRESDQADIPPVAGRGVQGTETVPGFGGPAPDGLFSLNQFGASNWYGGNPDFQLDEADTVRGIFGLPPGEAPFVDGRTFNDTEKTYAAYGQAAYTFNIGDKPVDGQFGLRVVKTDQNLRGQFNDGTPVDESTSQTDVLPFLNAKLRLQQNLLMRFALGRSVTRPDFSALNPVLNLTPPTTTGGMDGTGSGGNPDLDTVTSDHLDVSIENYFAQSSYVSLTGFYRKIDGYVQTFASRETIDGVPYIITRPRNTGDGKLYGFETAYQQFFDFLPGFLDGFGVHANYTYIDGDRDAPDNSPGAAPGDLIRQPYENVSKNNYNIILIYEKSAFSARLAYNWRDKFVSSYNGPNAPGSPLRTITAQDTDRLDFSASYRFGENWTVTLDATNLLNSKFQDYFFDPALYQRDTRLFDQTIELGVRYRY